MDPTEPRPGECQETAGFLFSHRCGDVAVRECVDCQKPICQRHSIDSGGFMRCVQCEKKRISEQNSGNRTDGGGANSYDSSSPFFYGYGYGYGYGPGYHWGAGHHSNHFSSWRTSPTHHNLTDSDEASLSGGETSAEDVRGFENEMGAS